MRTATADCLRTYRRVRRQATGCDRHRPEHQHRHGDDPRVQRHRSGVELHALAEQPGPEHPQADDGPRDGRELDVEVRVREQALAASIVSTTPVTALTQKPTKISGKNFSIGASGSTRAKPRIRSEIDRAEAHEERHAEGVQTRERSEYASTDGDSRTNVEKPLFSIASNKSHIQSALSFRRIDGARDPTRMASGRRWRTRRTAPPAEAGCRSGRRRSSAGLPATAARAGTSRTAPTPSRRSQQQHDQRPPTTRPTAARR